MAFLKENKRKTVTTSNINTDTVINISLRDKFIKDQDRSANFERLLYENCPAIPITDNYINIKIDKPGFVYANRQSLVVRICNAIHSLDATDRTKVNVFNETVRFLKMADEHKIKDVFCIDTISMYIKNLVGSYNKGSKGKTLSGRQNSIKALLKAMDYELYTKCESIFFLSQQIRRVFLIILMMKLKIFFLHCKLYIFVMLSMSKMVLSLKHFLFMN